MITQFELYKRVCNVQSAKMNEDAAFEVSERLWQLSYSRDQIESYLERYHSSERKNVQDYRELITSGDLVFKNARFYVESYYYFAHRIYKILTHKDSPLPYLSSFKCKGVALARNHLIEHPEGKSANATFPSYSYSKSTGFRLRTSGQSDQRVKDKGMVSNTKEFEGNFCRVVEAAIKRLRSHRA